MKKKFVLVKGTFKDIRLLYQSLKLQIEMMMAVLKNSDDPNPEHWDGVLSAVELPNYSGLESLEFEFIKEKDLGFAKLGKLEAK